MSPIPLRVLPLRSLRSKVSLTGSGDLRMAHRIHYVL